MSSSRHTLGTFDAALNALRADLFMMASLAERSLERAARGFFSRDEDLCNNVIADDEEIDALEVQIDRAGMELITRFQPVATDLRAVVSSMRISSNLERVGDQCVTIARRAKKLILEPELDDIHCLDRMFEITRGMLSDCIRAYADGDIELARTLKTRDRELDALNHQVSDTFVSDMQTKPEHVKGYLGLIFVARALERIGDHATNIGEDTVFALSAQDIRHTGAAS